MFGDFPGGPVVATLLLLQGAPVRSLVRKLRSHMPQDMARKEGGRLNVRILGGELRLLMPLSTGSIMKNFLWTWHCSKSLVCSPKALAAGLWEDKGPHPSSEMETTAHILICLPFILSFNCIYRVLALIQDLLKVGECYCQRDREATSLHEVYILEVHWSWRIPSGLACGLSRDEMNCK